MNIFSGILVYVLVWWMVLFCTLPFGIQSIENPKGGTMPGAPINHGLKRKVIITSLISAVVWVGIYLIVKSDLISFHDMAQRMEL